MTRNNWTQPRRRLLWLLYAGGMHGKVMSYRFGITELSIRSAISRLFKSQRPKNIFEGLTNEELQWLANQCEHREPHEVVAEAIRSYRQAHMDSARKQSSRKAV